MRKLIIFAVAAVVASGIGAANAQDSVPLGVKGGIYFPSSSKARQNFGDSWTHWGFSSVSAKPVSGGWRPTWDFEIYNNNGGGSRVTLIPVTLGVVKGLAADQDSQPYVAARAGVFWGDVRSSDLGVDTDKFGITGNVALGYVFNKKFFIEARYDIFDKVGGVDFSGASINAGVKLFDLNL